MVLPPEPLVRLPVHPLWLLGKQLRHVRAAAEPLPDRLRPAKGTCHLVLPLTLIDEIVAMTAQKVAPQTIKESCPPAAPCSRADRPRPLSAEVAPAEVHVA